LAQQYPPEAAALLGVYLHGQAGDLAAEKRGMAGMMAGDIVEAIHVGPKPQAG
jgi:NAD(P)H-hydrate epimerase